MIWAVTWLRNEPEKTQKEVRFIKYKRQFRGIGGRLGVAFLHLIIYSYYTLIPRQINYFQ